MRTRRLQGLVRDSYVQTILWGHFRSLGLQGPTQATPELVSFGTWPPLSRNIHRMLSLYHRRVSLALKHRTQGVMRAGGCLPELPSLPVADVVSQNRGQHTVAPLAGKGAFSGDKLASPSPSCSGFRPVRTAALSLPIVSRAPAGSGRGSLAPSALKCKEEQGCLLAGGQRGLWGRLVLRGLSQAALTFLCVALGHFRAVLAFMSRVLGVLRELLTGGPGIENARMRLRACQLLSRLRGQSASCVWHSRAEAELTVMPSRKREATFPRSLSEGESKLRALGTAALPLVPQAALVLTWVLVLVLSLTDFVT